MKQRTFFTKINGLQRPQKFQKIRNNLGSIFYSMYLQSYSNILTILEVAAETQSIIIFYHLLFLLLISPHSYLLDLSCSRRLLNFVIRTLEQDCRCIGILIKNYISYFLELSRAFQSFLDLGGFSRRSVFIDSTTFLFLVGICL